MVLTLPLELIEEIVDEAYSLPTTRVQHGAFLSSIACICAHFRYRVNRFRFHTISFSFRSSVYSRPRTRLTQFGDLISADERVWGKAGDKGVSGNTIAQHVREFTVDITAGEGYILGVLGDGVMVRIMRGLFRGSQQEGSPGYDHGDPCKFSLSCNVRVEGQLTLLNWTFLEKDFVDAFGLMCTTSRLSSLSLKGLRNFPTHLICESLIRQLHVESLVFQRTRGVIDGCRTLKPARLTDLIMDGLRFGIPDDNMILQITSFTACLWEANELPMLQDIAAGISKLAKLCICIGAFLIPHTNYLTQRDQLAPKSVPEELVAFDRDLPYLTELVIDLDLPAVPTFPVKLPLSFIIGPNTPPSVQQIEIRFAIYMLDFSPRNDMIERLRSILRLYSLHVLDQQLEIGRLRASIFKSALLKISVKTSSYIELDTIYLAQFSQKAQEMVLAFFPLLSSSKCVKLNIQVTLDGRREVWRRQSRNHGSWRFGRLSANTQFSIIINILCYIHTIYMHSVFLSTKIYNV